MRFLKKIYYLLFLVPVILPSYLNGQVDSLLYERNRSYENYVLIRDTMTIRTWINMRNYSENLEATVNADNLIIESLMAQIEIDNALWKKESDSLQKILTNKIAIIGDQDARINDSFYQLKFLIFTFGVLFVLLVVFIILTIVYIIKFRKWKTRFKDFGEQNHEATTGEVETLKQDVEKLKLELDASKGAYLTEKKSKESIETELRTLLEQLNH